MDKRPNERKQVVPPAPGTEVNVEPASALVGSEIQPDGAVYAAMRTYWRPTPDELVALQLGAAVEVTLLTLRMPPHHVGIA